MVSTYTSYQLITRDIDRSIDQIEKQPVTKRETEYYLANITKAKSIEDFLGDDRLFKYAMKAFGLKDMDYAKAFMKKVLTEGIEDPDSFANSLTDKRYRNLPRPSISKATADRDRVRPGAAGNGRQISAPDARGETPASRTRACGWRSTSSARRRA